MMTLRERWSAPNSTWLGLIPATTVAILLRSIPAWTNAAWGNDLGIYYGITTLMIRNQHLFINYTGWGNSYQFFPVLYLIAASLHIITGLDLLWLLPKIAPIIGGLTIPILYLIVLELLKNRKIALVSSFLLTIAPFHVYQTSHAAPLTVGHFFMLLSIYLFIKFSKRPMFLFPLLFSTVMLILSHHLTTYFYIISVTAMFFITMLNKNKIDKQTSLPLLYLSISSSLMFSYWAAIAKPVFYSFIPGGIPFSSYHAVILYYLLLYGGTFAIIRGKKWVKKTIMVNWGRQYSVAEKIMISFSIILMVELFFVYVPIPGVNLRITPVALLYSIPIVLFFSLSASGFSELRNKANGGVVLGWVSAIFLSLLYSLIYGKTNIYPDRHLEYLIIPLCIPAAFSGVKLSEVLYTRNITFSRLLKFSKLKHLYTTQTVLSVIITLIVVSNMIVVYPAFDAMNAADERISESCINAIRWMDGNISKNSVVASDHRLSMLIWAKGFNITMGKTNLTWAADSWIGCYNELKELNVSYILIDDIMRERVVNVGVGEYYYMNNESYEKFTMQPFELVYRNATLDSLREEVHWAEIYRINWTQLGCAVTAHFHKLVDKEIAR
ncbi:MAG TPA: hypothetical protein EYP23_06435 [Thermoplasmata archaeon]|nr:hypothetical protein [Thermoplasmata archaeon]